MAKKKETSAEKPEAKNTPPAADQGAAPAEKKKESVSVFDSKNGKLIRTYSLKVHGENFEDMAKEFVSKAPDKREIKKEK